VRALLGVPNIDLIEAGVVIVAAKIEIDEVVVIKLTRELQRLLGRLGFEVAAGVVRGGEKLGAIDFVSMCIPLFVIGWKERSVGL
jgi:hypothetical protein